MCKRSFAWMIAVSLLPLAFLTGCQSMKTQTASPAARDGVFIHIKEGADNPHAVLMALKMASLMSEGRDVLVYFDLKGVGATLKDAPDIAYPTFESSRTQLAALTAKGVPIYVCPGCLKAAGKQPEDVMPGLKIAEKDVFFSFTKGRILTLDY